MAELIISENSGSSDLAPIALAVNQILGLPVTLRSLRAPGVRVEGGKVLDESYSGPALEEAMASGKAVRTVPKRGVYQGVPVSVSPIFDRDGEVIAAMGVVDVVGTIDIPSVFGAYTQVVKEVSRNR
ncbi:MAG: DUF2111 domain-containing protein [Methanothrix sp.]|jgi:hypothetical protein|nr:DUF2111 domain-containing protein [Methanothrix sp.]OPX80296.1 MAG: hypothetical protein A4E50_01633 [Methanosaeta sp. PtaB.Bin087]OPY51319.1 MAG: hypothetical protein A4E51_01546 [Methanosaeta sp. PtaU1.Bin055]NLX40182.1 DUF2111 domain-containing protein [Methanothrix sp.]HNR56856.1 DUF2111 domain-containing protein [Methanothrix sp.]